MIERHKTGSAFLKSDIVLSPEGKAPTELRLLKAGANESDYGPFEFDELAAALVMASFGTKAIQRLYSDWNHEMVPKYPGERITREMGKSSCSFIPEIRKGELWAADIQWSETGRQDVESREYNLFSPSFNYEFGEDGVCRPRKLINFALVNLAGLNGIAPLTAAMAKQEAEEMEFERLYHETKTQLEAANARIKTLEHAGGEVVALSAAVGLSGDVPSKDRLTTVQGLVTPAQLRPEAHRPRNAGGSYRRAPLHEAQRRQGHRAGGQNGSGRDGSTARRTDRSLGTRAQGRAPAFG